jgi:hypothetical protein
MWYDLFLQYFWNEFINDFLELFSYSSINVAGIWLCPVAFQFFNLPVAISYLFIIWWFSLYTHCPLFSTVTVCSILQFKVFLIIFIPPLQDFLFVAYYVTFPISNQSCLWFEPLFCSIHFLMKFLCFIVTISNFHLLELDLNNTLFVFCLNNLCAFLLSLYSCSFCLVFLLIILL